MILTLMMLLTLVCVEASAEEIESDFKSWGIGWQYKPKDRGFDYYSSSNTFPAIRYRTDSGWTLTLAAWFKPTERNSESDGSGYFVPGETGNSKQDYEIKERQVHCDLSRQFKLIENVSIGPMLGAGHKYYRSENTQDSWRRNSDGELIAMESSFGIHRFESWHLDVGLRPIWQIHPRISIEMEMRISYQKDNTKTDSFSEGFDEWSGEGSTESNEKQSYGTWAFFPSSISPDMNLSLFICF